MKANLTLNRRPLKNSIVKVSWRDEVLQLLPSDKDLWVGSVDVREKTDPGPARIKVSSLSFPSKTFTIQDQGTHSNGELTFGYNIESERRTVILRGVYIDGETREAITNSKFYGTIGNTNVNILTDNDGRFTIFDVCEDFTFSVRDLEPSQNVLIENTASKSINLKKLNNQEIIIKRNKQDALRISIDPETGTLLKNSSLGSIFIDLTPLTLPTSSIEGPWDAFKTMSTDNRMKLANGNLEYPPLPKGVYLLSILIPEHGAFTSYFSVKEDKSTPKIKVLLKPKNERIEFSLLNRGIPVANALIVDGRLSHTAFKSARSLFTDFFERHKYSKTPKAVVFTDKTGKASLTRSSSLNKEVTVFTSDGGTFHLPKKSGLFELQAFKDLVVSGYIKDSQGNPVKNAQIQLTGFNGGEHKHLEKQMPRPRELDQTRTDDRGYFEITGVIPGSYLFSLSFFSSSTRPDGQIDQVFQVDRSTYRIARVLDNIRNFNIQLKHEVKRCMSCGQFHSESHNEKSR